VITIREEQLVVISPIEGTPAHKAGVKAGDKIIKINGESTEGITLFEAVHKLRGPKGTKVTITIRRKEEGEEEQELEFTITRDIIEIESVKYSLIDEVKDCKIGYVKITNFNEKTVKELREALNKLKKEGMEELILDLRHNPGGLLDAAVDVADEFFDKELIVSTKGRKPNQCKEYKARAGGSYVEGPLIVLIDGASASASEIVAGAIKDNARGVVLGKKSFGKGSVQTVLELKDGSAVAITTAKYFTPNGVSIHKVGIEPDIVVERMKIGKEEVRLLRKLREENYIKEFIDKHSFPYEEEDFEKFVATLSEKGFKLRKCLIREEINKEWRKMNDIKEPIYHLLLDTQLQRAVDILIASKKLEKTTK
jgi:carboxyl-terminal processing protease